MLRNMEAADGLVDRSGPGMIDTTQTYNIFVVKASGLLSGSLPDKLATPTPWRCTALGRR